MKFDSIENEVLVLLTYTATRVEKRQRLEQLLCEAIDWRYLFTLANYHGVLPQIHRYLSSSPISSITEAELRQLKENYKTNTLRNMSLTGELVSILRLLKRADIAAIPLKGPVLAQLLYGDIALRTFGDLDVLVRKEQFDQAVQALMTIGYRYSGDQTDDFGPKVARGKHHHNFVKNNQFYVELHSTLEPLNYSSEDDTVLFWESVRSVFYFGIPMTIPATEELLLFLCRHGSRHFWDRLKWLNDIAQLLHNEKDLDWNYILTQFNSRTRSDFFLGLYLTQKLFDSTLPEHVLREIQDDGLITELGSRTLGIMFAELGREPSPMDYWKKEKLRVQLREGRFQQLRYIYSSLSTYIKRFVSNLRPNDRDRA